MGDRREQRIKATLPVLIRGMDADGAMFQKSVTTFDITPHGARLRGITFPLLQDARVNVQRGATKASFRVAWVGEPGSAEQHQIGVELLEPAKYIWGVALQTKVGDDYAGSRRAQKS